MCSSGGQFRSVLLLLPQRVLVAEDDDAFPGFRDEVANRVSHVFPQHHRREMSWCPLVIEAMEHNIYTLHQSAGQIIVQPYNEEAYFHMFLTRKDNVSKALALNVLTQQEGLLNANELHTFILKSRKGC